MRAGGDVYGSGSGIWGRAQIPTPISGLVLVDAIDLRSASRQRQTDPFILALKEDYPRAIDRFVSACVPEKESDHIKRWGRMILNRASQEAAIALYQMGNYRLARRSAPHHPADADTTRR